jgi:hypothetical protein
MEKKLRFLEVLFSIIAVVVSGVAIYISTHDSDKALKVATEALQTSRQANDIALGRLKEEPIIGVLPNRASLVTTADIPKTRIEIGLENTGNVAISGVEVIFVAIGPITYRLNNAMDQYKDFPHESIKVDFDQQLSPRGNVRIDLRNPMVKYLSELPLAQPNELYIAGVNVVVVPQRVGDPLPIQSTLDSRGLINVEFIPNILRSEAVTALVKSEPSYQVLPAAR